MAWFFVFVGGGFGSLLRYFFSTQIHTEVGKLPYATLIANFLSCLILGALTAYQIKYDLHKDIALLLMTGLCGGFSTFSTFSGELFVNLQAGNNALAFGYLAASVVGGLFMFWLGYLLLN